MLDRICWRDSTGDWTVRTAEPDGTLAVRTGRARQAAGRRGDRTPLAAAAARLRRVSRAFFSHMVYITFCVINYRGCSCPDTVVVRRPGSVTFDTHMSGHYEQPNSQHLWTSKDSPFTDLCLARTSTDKRGSLEVGHVVVSETEVSAPSLILGGVKVGTVQGRSEPRADARGRRRDP